VSRVVRAVKIPVIATGGIVHAEGVAAAMALGAAGVQVGTAYLRCHQANTSRLRRAALKTEAAGDSRHHTFARQGGKYGYRRFLAAVVRRARERLQRDCGCPTHARVGTRRLIAPRAPNTVWAIDEFQQHNNNTGAQFPH